MNRNENIKPDEHEISGDGNEETLLGEMFAAAGDERWDASPGFEARLDARLADERARSFDTGTFIWKVVPAAAVVSVIAVAGLFLAGSLDGLSDYLVTSSLDPVAVEDMITFGSF